MTLFQTCQLWTGFLTGGISFAVLILKPIITEWRRRQMRAEVMRLADDMLEEIKRAGGTRPGYMPERELPREKVSLAVFGRDEVGLVDFRWDLGKLRVALLMTEPFRYDR
jgi:hypothetical protein